MYTRNSALLCLALLTSLSATAQKKHFTIAEATNGIVTTLAPQSIKGAVWEPNSYYFYFKPGAKRWVVYNPVQDRIDTLRSVDNKDFPFQTFRWLSRDSAEAFRNDSSFYLLGANQGMWIATVGKKHAAFDNEVLLHRGSDRAGTRGNNIVLSVNDEERQITNDTDPNIINGQAVHRNEWGIDGGLFPSPNGNYLAYYRMDQRMVKDYPVIDWGPLPAVNTNVKYPMAGDSSHVVTLRVYNIATGKTIELKTGKGDQFLTCVTWSPDEKYIYIAILNRAQNHLWLNQYSATTGEKIKTLLQEKDDKYVEPQHPLTFLPGSTNEFIWWSQQDGYMHLWLCDMARNKMKCLTPGPYVVNELLGFNTRTSEVFFTSAKEDPREKHGYAVHWKTGKMRRLDTEPGTHNYLASSDCEYFFDVITGRGIPKKSVIRNISGKIVRVLIDSPDPLANYDRPRIIDTSLLAADGKTKLYAKLILPTNFNPQKKYPVVVYLYNGPHAQLIKNGFPESGNLWYEYLAQKGYVVWSMDGRGSSNRGLAFEQVIFRHLGDAEMDDQLEGVKFLKKLPYVDGSRLGVHGWSYGGFMTTSLILRHPGVFKVGVAGGPVLDWRMYEIMYGERYMDTPQENPDGYAANNLLTKVKNLQGKLLMIHGALDATVVWQHSMNFLRECVMNGVQMDYFVYPAHEHNVRGKDRVHLMQKITDYFDQNL